MGQLSALARMRAQAVRNSLSTLSGDRAVKAAVVTLGMVLVSLLAYSISYGSFRFIETFPAIGAPLNERLLALFFLILLVMVALSTAVVAYTTLFLAGETHFLFQHPLPPRVVFFTKLAESVALSGWATLVLGMPVLAAFGQVRGARPSFYAEAGLALVLFLVFCGSLGAAATLLLLEIVNRWTWRRLLVLGALLAGLGTWLFLRSFDFRGLNGEENLQVLDRFTQGLSTLASPYFPGRWMAALVVAAAAGEEKEVFFQGGLLLANTLIFLPLFWLYCARRYGRRWLSALEPSAPRTGRAAKPAGAVRAAPSGRLFPARGPTGSLIRKDLLVFARDPAQITQFVLFVLLLMVYVASLVQIPRDLFGEGWKLVIYFANLGAISLILSSFTSRFLFPLLSLEGKSFWIVGLAPLSRAFLVRQKAVLGGAFILALGFAASLASGVFLGVRGSLLLGGIYTTLLSGSCLCGLAAGLGAAYPSLGEDNPARIAVGLGGTLNFFASAGAVLILLAIEGAPYLLSWPRPPAGVLLAHLGALLFAASVSAYALRLGRRAMEALEI
jgi:ABC-2 type transport system permease protein